MNTTLYVSKAGEQIYSDAQVWATRHKISLSRLVEVLLDLTTTTDARKNFYFRQFHRAIRAALKAQPTTIVRRNGAGVSKRPAKKVVR